MPSSDGAGATCNPSLDTCLLRKASEARRGLWSAGALSGNRGAASLFQEKRKRHKVDELSASSRADFRRWSWWLVAVAIPRRRQDRDRRMSLFGRGRSTPWQHCRRIQGAQSREDHVSPEWIAVPPCSARTRRLAPAALSPSSTSSDITPAHALLDADPKQARALETRATSDDGAPRVPDSAPRQPNLTGSLGPTLPSAADVHWRHAPKTLPLQAVEPNSR